MDENSNLSTNNFKKKYTILIVENEIDVQTFLSSTLSKKYNIGLANNGVEALKMIAEQASDLVISDVMMPEMDGFELCEKIKSDAKMAPISVLLLTALGNSEDMIKGLEFESLNIRRKQPKQNQLKAFPNYELAYHQLMLELVAEQIKYAERAIGKTKIKKIYIDGGFAGNDLFIKLLLFHFDQYKIHTTQAPLGSALGAAMVINDKKVKSNFLKKQYALKKQRL